MSGHNAPWTAQLRVPALLLGLGALVALGWGAAYRSDALDDLEVRTLDARFELRGSQGAPSNVVIVAIDDQALIDAGERWPFRRSLHARAINRLRSAGARTIAYDLQFAQPTTEDEDRALIDAARQAGNVVLATSVVDRRGRTNILGGDAVLRDIHASVGNVNLPTGVGGVLRQVPHTVQRLSSFAVVAAARYLGRPVPARASARWDRAWIDYRGPPGTVHTVPFVRVLAGDFRTDTFQDKIVVVGATAPILQDVHATSIASAEVMSGVEIQANAIDTVLRGRPLRDGGVLLGIALIAALALLPALVSLRAALPAVIGVSLGALIGLLAAAQAAFNAGTVLPVVYPALALLTSAASTLAVKHHLADRERRRLRELFADFAPEVVERVLERQPGSNRLALAASQIVGGYRLEGVVGRGGMGVVYRAVELKLERRVALKLLAPEHWYDEDFRERFRRESRLAASIEHPHVIPVYEAGDDDGLLFIAMRYVVGADLHSIIALDAPLPPARVARITDQIAAALDAAHQTGLVHRDVKPANILLTADREEHAYLTDFGIARMATGGQTLTQGGALGTPAYMAPEQLTDSAVDHRADIFALGYVTYHALTGANPRSVPIPISRSANRLPPAVDHVLARATHVDPTERQTTAGRFALDLSAALEDAGMSGSAPPDSDRKSGVGDPALRTMTAHDRRATT